MQGDTASSSEQSIDKVNDEFCDVEDSQKTPDSFSEVR